MGKQSSRKPLIGSELSITMTKDENVGRYLNKMPSKEVVRKVVKKATRGNKQVFEKMYGLPLGTIRQYLGGFRKTLPTHFWHIFYELPKINKIALGKSTDKLNEGISTPHEKHEPIKKPVVQISEQNKKRLDEYRKLLAGGGDEGAAE